MEVGKKQKVKKSIKGAANQEWDYFIWSSLCKRKNISLDIFLHRWNHAELWRFTFHEACPSFQSHCKIPFFLFLCFITRIHHRVIDTVYHRESTRDFRLNQFFYFPLFNGIYYSLWWYWILLYYTLLKSVAD